MDGLTTLMNTSMWNKLKSAKEKVFELQRDFERNGFSSDFVYASRCKLTDAENQLRQHFKRLGVD